LNTDLPARWLGRPHHGQGALQLGGADRRTARWTLSRGPARFSSARSWG